jgi:molybdenum cofactor biosynthesis protein MoaC
MYAWGVVGVVILSTLYLLAFGGRSWMYLALFWSIVPLVAFLMFLKSKLPEMNNFGGEQKKTKIFSRGIILCALCIFCGGAAECTMGQWASGFIENAIGIPKVYGDVLGVARVAGIMAVKQTSSIIPMCHPLMISKCSIDFEPEPSLGTIKAICTVKVEGKTGVEMEALHGVSAALLTIYDMCKAIDKRMVIKEIHLVEKHGGKSGDFYYD